jgi:hypothetical protein
VPHLRRTLSDSGTIQLHAGRGSLAVFETHHAPRESLLACGPANERGRGQGLEIRSVGRMLWETLMDERLSNVGHPP